MPRTSTKLVDEPIYFSSPAALGSWLSKNHATKTELWALTWPLAVDEALCWGWIDGIKKRVDADRTMQRFTPRKAKSHWSAVNVAKVAVLEAAGRMQEPGRAAFALRTEENTGQTSFESRDAVPLSREFTERLEESIDISDPPWDELRGHDMVVLHEAVLCSYKAFTKIYALIAVC
ncbi:hypothetical protein B0H14DRAFT_3427683 [Mycena olivaceomarginata]|nr:hypothetical protein B0H14DRAFT_3427683 [Mycena olivaceomarginata]